MAFVSHAHALERHIAVEPIGAQHGPSGVDGAAQEGPEIPFERSPSSTACRAEPAV
jgi:hypothetical protein